MDKKSKKKMEFWKGMQKEHEQEEDNHVKDKPFGGNKRVKTSKITGK